MAVRCFVVCFWFCFLFLFCFCFFSNIFIDPKCSLCVLFYYYFRTGVTPDSAGRSVYYYVVSNRAPFALGCFGPITTEAECRALYTECDGVAQSLTTAHGTDNYDLDCPCFDPVTGSNMPGQGKPKFLGANGFDAYQLDLMDGDKACNALDGSSQACTQEEKDAVAALYSSEKCSTDSTDSNTDPNTDSGSTSTTPSSEPTSNAIPDVEVEYAVEHTIILKGISANQFNEDPLIVESFLESVSKLLNVPITDIFNVVAISKNRLRNLDGSAACDVSYEVKVNSVTEMNTMSSNIQDTFTNNKAGDTTFTDALQTAMKENNVSSIELSSITSDTTSAPKDAGTLNPNNSNEGNTEVGNDDSKDNTVPVEPDKQNVDIGLIAGLSIGGLLILSLVGYVFFARSKRIININIPSVGVEMSDSTIKMKDMGYANPMNMNKMRV